MCKDLQLFEKWQQAGDKAMTSEELAQSVQCEPALLGKHASFRDVHEY